MAIVGEKQIQSVQRCGKCGRRSVSAGACSACGQTVKSDATLARSERRQQLRSFESQGLIIPHREIIATVLRPSATPVSNSAAITADVARRIRGRVIVAKSSANEPMDFDPWRWIAIPSWGLIILISPVIGAIIAWQAVGFLGAAIVAVITFFVLRFMFSNRLLQSWYFVSALNGRNVVEMMPVTMIRLRQAEEREVQLRLKGQLQGGSVIEGDRISAAGRWRRGVFHVRHISCERTGATIIPKQPNARGWAIAGLCVLGAAGLWLHFIGGPWVAQQARSLQPVATWESR